MNTQLLDVSSRAADTFVPAFYSMFDRQRHALANLYGETSVLVWNGNTTQGAAAIARSYLDFPISDHEVLSYDCQPLTESSDILVTISGNVRYGDEQRRKLFHQSFVLRQRPESKGNYFIVTDTFRFV
ncbi:hypothetical protein HK105_208567 [Polyrhizophydium stewartii]|uniref:Nuclear transport factor 2 n=1 Tax=Polyrhizophydium stewartii TaxID=2732419 RepID=A0ABR4MXG8_9FUNG